MGRDLQALPDEGGEERLGDRLVNRAHLEVPGDLDRNRIPELVQDPGELPQLRGDEGRRRADEDERSTRSGFVAARVWAT
jgi:hypothetical protein